MERGRTRAARAKVIGGPTATAVVVGGATRAMRTRALLKVSSCGVTKYLKSRSEVVCVVSNVIQILNCSVFCSRFVTWCCGGNGNEDSGKQMTRGGLYCYFICCYILANSFLLAIGRRSRIVEIGR